MIVFNYIQIIKDNIYDITWENFENKLYQVVISENDLLNQFDNEKNFRRINKILKREILYFKFLDFLKSYITCRKAECFKIYMWKNCNSTTI